MNHVAELVNPSMLKRLLPSRIVLMMLLAGGLYLGPFLAGLSQQPRWTVAAFALIMFLWSTLYRGALRPRRVTDLAKPEVAAAIVLPAGLMLVLSSLFFLAGFGLSRIGGAMSLPLPLCLGIPVLSLFAAMVVQSPRKAAEMDAFLDDALGQLEGFPVLSSTTEPSPIAKAVAENLVRLRDDATVAEIRAVVGEAAVHDATLLALIDKMGAPPPRPALLAAILIVTDPTGGPALEGRGEAAWVFDALRGDHELEALFANRAVTLLAAAPHLWRDMPYSYDVNEAAVGSSDLEAAESLGELRDRLNDLSNAEDGPAIAESSE